MARLKRRRRVGAGTVRQLPSGRWQARRVDRDGTLRSLGTFRSKFGAQERLVLAEADELRGVRHVAKTGGTVGEWAQRWLAEAEHRLRATSLAGYKASWTLYAEPRWGKVAVKDITRRQVTDWVGELAAAGHQPDTIRRALQPLRLALQVAVDAEAIPANPAARVRTPSVRHREMRVLTVDQVEVLAEAISHPVFRPAGNGARSAARSERPDLGLAVRLAAYTGLRAGELWALRRSRIDLDRRVLTVAESVTEVAGKLVWSAPKTGQIRAVTFPSELVPALKAQLEQVGAGSGALVFPSSTGEAIRHRTFVARHFRPAVERAGLVPLRWHDLRHTHASLMIALGAHPKAVAERLGHSSVQITLDRYGHLFPGLGDQLASALDGLIAESRDARGEVNGT